MTGTAGRRRHSAAGRHSTGPALTPLPPPPTYPPTAAAPPLAPSLPRSLAPLLQNLIFRFLQSRQKIQIWLYEQTDLRVEGRIIVRAVAPPPAAAAAAAAL